MLLLFLFKTTGGEKHAGGGESKARRSRSANSFSELLLGGGVELGNSEMGRGLAGG